MNLPNAKIRRGLGIGKKDVTTNCDINPERHGYKPSLIQSDPRERESALSGVSRR